MSTRERADGRGGDGPMMGRRTFLSAAAVAGVAGLAGCSVSVDVGGGGGGGTPESTTGNSQVATPTPERTPTENPDRSTTTAPTDRSTTDGTSGPPEYEVVTADPETTEYEVVTMEPQTPEYEVVTPDPQPARYRIHDVTLYVVSANDSKFNGPKTEEVWGHFHVKGYDSRDGSDVFADGHDGTWVYSIDREDAVSLGEGGIKRLPIDVVVEFPDPGTVERDASYISFGANLLERDGNKRSDDRLGWWDTGHHYDWFLSQEPSDPDRTDPNGESQFTVYYEDRRSEVRLSFDVTPVE